MIFILFFEKSGDNAIGTDVECYPKNNIEGTNYKMRNLNLLLILTLITSSLLYSQEDTFGRLYRQHSTIFTMQETADGGFILGGNNGIIKTYLNGRAEWQDVVSDPKRVGYLTDGIHAAIQDKDGTYLFAYIKSTPESQQLWINRYSSSGMSVSQNLIIDADDIDLFSFQKAMDSGYVVLVRANYASNPSLIKLDDNLVPEWQSAFQSFTSFRSIPNFTPTLDSGFIAIGANGPVTKFNNAGDTVWAKPDLKRYFLITGLKDSSFVMAGFGLLARLSKDGSLISETYTDILYPNDLFINPDESFIYLCGKSDNSFSALAKYDLNFNHIRTDSLNQNVLNNVMVNSQNSILVSGMYTDDRMNTGFLLQLDSAGFYEYMMLEYPQDNEYLQVSNMLNIRWATTLPGNINIYYSLNNGINWETIISGYPADSSHYRWQLPGLPNNHFLIRIESASQPEWYDQTDFPMIIGGKTFDFITVNECAMWFANNGMGSHDPYTDANGFYWPGGRNATKSSIFADGLVWGGYVDDSIRVNGNTHRQGLRPGNILKDGIPADPGDPRFGIWRANRDWQSFPEGPEKDRLHYDWNNWPVDLGAPWEDNDGNGLYDPVVDNPKISGDETFWVVMNDLDTTTTRFTYGSDPIGLEIQLQVYAYNRTDDLADVVFKKYRMYNKGPNQVDSMFFSYWSDPDLGDASDDFVGCDTLLNLAYCYNDGKDYIYGTKPPAVGYLLLQGPVVSAAATDSAYVFDQWQFGYINKDIYAFILFIGSSATYSDPSMGVIRGSYELYNNLSGRIWNGNPIINPHTSEPTRFALAGDPVNGTGWYEDDGWPNGPRSNDRRMVMSSGPFTFAPGDSQEVVYAIIMAQGDDPIDSVRELKRKAAAVKEFYYTGILPVAIEDENPVKPAQFSLSQNYPNPFNPVTTISYTLPMPSDVELSIYNILGQRVAILVSEKKQQAGSHKIQWDAGKMASGIYYYKLEAGKSFSETKKLVVLK
ncbi:MAG: T9SS type A sorting domain-containing protein [Calditrichaeota bacterium]|nr:T9SS type A sorting domain-containing protein [Calditrichota bacterium]